MSFRHRAHKGVLHQIVRPVAAARERPRIAAEPRDLLLDPVRLRSQMRSAYKRPGAFSPLNSAVEASSTNFLDFKFGLFFQAYQ